MPLRPWYESVVESGISALRARSVACPRPGSPTLSRFPFGPIAKKLRLKTMAISIALTPMSDSRQSIATADPELSFADDRATGAERRSEPRYGRECSTGTAGIMGHPGTRALCRIVDISRAGMRIESNARFEVGTQVHVQWGERFFVGDCCFRLQKGESHIHGLKLVTANYGRLPGNAGFALSRLMAFCRAKVKAYLAGRS